LARGGKSFWSASRAEADFASDCGGSRLGMKLREPDLALEEARSDLRCYKNLTLEKAYSGRSRSKYGGKGINP
jgi:hypothetical protein